jgi:hypothetical protein
MLTKPLGLDASYTGFGVSSGKETIEIKTEPNNEQTTSQNCQRRCQEIVAKIVAFVNRNYAPDDAIMVVLEAPSFGSFGNPFETGWLFCELYNRLMSMVNRPMTICEVPPSTLKKWVTGSGKTTDGKEPMRAAVKERWGVEFEMDKKHNKGDAFCLYKYGVAILEGDIQFTPTARRGKGKKTVARKKAEKNKRVKSTTNSTTTRKRTPKAKATKSD